MQGIRMTNKILKYKLLIVLLLFISYNINAQLIVPTTTFLNSGLDIFTFLKISKDDAKSIKTVIIEEYDYYNTLPISAKEFPNIKEIRIENSYNLYDLKGLSDFRKLRKLYIDVPASDKAATDMNIQYNLSEIWKLKQLNELTINAPLYNINDSITNLTNLKKLSISTYNIPFEILLKMPWVKEFNCFPFKEIGEFNSHLFYFINQKFSDNKNSKKINNYLKVYGVVDLYKTIINTYNEYTVSDKGNYILTYKNGLVAIRGYYKNGLRDSIWTIYDELGNMTSKTNYNSGLLTDIYYYRNSWDNKTHTFNVDKKHNITTIHVSYKLNNHVKIEEEKSLNICENYHSDGVSLVKIDKEKHERNITYKYIYDKEKNVALEMEESDYYVYYTYRNLLNGRAYSVSYSKNNKNKYSTSSSQGDFKGLYQSSDITYNNEIICKNNDEYGEILCNLTEILDIDNAKTKNSKQLHNLLCKECLDNYKNYKALIKFFETQFNEQNVLIEN